ncbi:hypothetical protein [Actinocorallia herbida]|uniref:hypothetical protein n=1 Tax=Actinocorallia herbida TaxID=58109 RepID=UPI0011CE0A4F|nr:hypothetical protein [Actinocorallia herbida]
MGNTATAQRAAWEDLPSPLREAVAATGVPRDAVTSYAVAFAGYCARCPAPPAVPNLRPYQARAAAAALHWVRHRTGW